MQIKEYNLNYFYGWWKNIDKSILFIVLTLFCLGLFFSFVSTSLIASDKLQTNSYYFFLKHFLFVMIGIVSLFGFSILNQKQLFLLSKILFIIFLILLILVPFLGVEVKGSKRWIEIGFMPRLQPIELLKPFFVVMISSALVTEKYKNKYFNYFISLFILIPVVFLLSTQPDIGQSLLVTMTWLALIFVSGINLYIFFYLSFYS